MNLGLGIGGGAITFRCTILRSLFHQQERDPTGWIIHTYTHRKNTIQYKENTIQRKKRKEIYIHKKNIYKQEYGKFQE